MGIENIFIWYQQKIGTYDKQKWETKIEQKEQKIYGLPHVQTRSTKPNTDLIDLDLVRGSSFTKAKPQHGFIKVVRLATLRCVFYPLYGKWWIKQTSGYVFSISLFIYVAQIINTVIYFTCTLATVKDSEALTCMEMVVPFIMMWVLSLIHSQIVATSPLPEAKTAKVKHRQYRRRRKSFSQNSKPKDTLDRSKCCQKTARTKNGKKILKHAESLSALDTCFKRAKSLEEKVNFNDGAKLNENITKHDLNHIVPNSSPKYRVTFVKNSLNPEVEKLISSVCNPSIPEEQPKFCSTDSESERECPIQKLQLVMRRRHHIPAINITSTRDSTCYDTDDENETLSSPETKTSTPLVDDVTSSATDWMGATTNSEDCSYSSDMENISEDDINHDNDYLVYDNDTAPTAILNPPSVKVSCIIWERNEIKKADLSMLDISSAIIGKVESMQDSMDYFYIGLSISVVLAVLPVTFRVCNTLQESNMQGPQHFFEEIYRNLTLTLSYPGNCLSFYHNLIRDVPWKAARYVYLASGSNIWELSILTIASFQRWILASMIFFLLSIAERTFKQRLLYAKLFSHLTSSRRARKSDLPHFRLNKVRNIKTWLSVRSYLKKRGPQRSVDVIVSTAFIANLLLLIFLCVQVLKDVVLFTQYYLEALIWCLGLGILLLRFMTLGTKINKKYRNLSVLITEQINLHLQIEQKPHKKDEYGVANNVLKLAIDLLKELENPFKISGLSANPLLYNITKLVILSALSGVLSDMLGFKLKLHKIKLK